VGYAKNLKKILNVQVFCGTIDRRKEPRHVSTKCGGEGFSAAKNGRYDE
jgi:hypothetical protein